jgi:hypothetical protein
MKLNFSPAPLVRAALSAFASAVPRRAASRSAASLRYAA